VRTTPKGRAVPRKRHTVPRSGLLAVLVAGVVLVAGITVFASTGGGDAGGTTTTAGRGATMTAGGQGQSTGTAQTGTSASASRDGKAPRARKPILTAKPQPPVTPGAKWLTGTANSLLGAVNTDMGKISAYQRAGDYTAARSTGAKLAADALAALNGPMPPVDAALYRSALKDFEQIGADAASGNFDAAGSLAARANVGIMTVTAAADPPATANGRTPR
jgi:hypothetical protein